MGEPHAQVDVETTRHASWAKISHWIVASSFLALAFSGFVIFMCHPRLYWGEVGNDLTPALLELPVSRNFEHGGWADSVPYFADSVVQKISAVRTYEIFNENGWGRSLHFLAAWLLVGAGAVYLLAGIGSGHLWRHLVPRATEFTPSLLWQDLKSHLRLQIRPPTGGPQYGLLQKCAYFAVVLVVLPLEVLTGLTMSPAITAAYPFLLDVFGGFQSARTIHFFAFFALVLFLFGHVMMIIKSGFKRQIRAMTIGE